MDPSSLPYQRELVSVENLKIAYPHPNGGFYHVINGVNLKLNQGETLGMVGESGCGKSTVAKALMGLLPSHVGISHTQFHFKGESLPRQGSAEWRKLRGQGIAMIFQNPMSCLNPYLNIQNQLCEGLQYHFHYTSKVALGLAIQYLEEVMIPEPLKLLKKYPHELSGGLCQRVMIAMALSFKPKLLIADEPSTALDVSTQASIMELLQSLQLKLGMGLILVSHDLALVAQQCKNIAVMYAGKIVEDGPTSEVLKNPLHPYTQCLLSARPPLRGKLKGELNSLPGQAPQLREPPTGCSLAPRCPKAMPMCQQMPIRKTTASHRSYLCHLEIGHHAP